MPAAPSLAYLRDKMVLQLIRWSCRTMLFFSCLLPLQAGEASSPPSLATYEFGLSLATGPHSQLFTCFQVKIFEGNVISTEGLTPEQFILQAQGIVPSKANPENTDLFERYQVTSCRAELDSVHNRYQFSCDPFKQLWKLRFWEYPFRLSEGQHPGQGWAENKSMPSERQLLLLSNYGLRYATDICYGEAVFRLLKDIEDPAWVDNYRKGY